MYYQPPEKTLEDHNAILTQRLMDAQLQELDRLTRLARLQEHTNTKEARLASSQILRMRPIKLTHRIGICPYDPKLAAAHGSDADAAPDPNRQATAESTPAQQCPKSP